MSSQRYIEPLVLTDLGRKMVFIAGPRQSGKTTFAEDLAQRNFPKRHLYLNWDAPRDRKRILAQDWDAATELIILDELHKYARWKSWLKGVYDTSKTRHKFIVTGSARMDVYRRGGLQGRACQRRHAAVSRTIVSAHRLMPSGVYPSSRRRKYA